MYFTCIRDFESLNPCLWSFHSIFLHAIMECDWVWENLNLIVTGLRTRMIFLLIAIDICALEVNTLHYLRVQLCARNWTYTSYAQRTIQINKIIIRGRMCLQESYKFLENISKRALMSLDKGHYWFTWPSCCKMKNKTGKENYSIDMKKQDYHRRPVVSSKVLTFHCKRFNDL